MEERTAGRDLLARLARVRLSGRLAAAAGLVAASALIALVAVPPALRALSAGLSPASQPISAAQAERHLAARYPRLRRADHAVIACPERRIHPGGQARCWILARVGQQRAVTVRLSARGNAVRVED